MSLRISSLIFVTAAMLGFQFCALADTSETSSTNASISTPLAKLAQHIASADSVIVTNWTGTRLGQPAFTVSVPSNDVAKIIHAVSSATFAGGQEHPDWEFDWKLLFYQGTNLLGEICFNGGSFLKDGVWNDESGILGKISRKASNREYVARVYGDEEKDFNETKKAEAGEWLKSSLHTIIGEDKKRVLKFVNDFYAAGAEKVYLADITTHFNGKNPPMENAKCLLVFTPQDEATRRRFFVVHWQVVKAIGFDGDGDVGQKYTWYLLDWHNFW